MENAQVIGSYYPPSKVTDEDRADEISRPALAGRCFKWVDWDDAHDTLINVAQAVLTAPNAQEAGVMARRVIEDAIEAWTQSEVEAES